MNKKAVILLGLALVAGGVGVLTLDDVTIESDAIYEYQVVPKAIRASNNKHVRVVGSSSAAVTVEDSDLGRIIVTGVDKNAICSVAFEEGDALPDNLQEYADIYKKIDGSFLGGTYIWWGIFKYKGCDLVAGHPGYLGSTMKEFLALPARTRGRFLKTDGKIVRFPFALQGRLDLTFIEEVDGELEKRYAVPAEGFSTPEEK